MNTTKRFFFLLVFALASAETMAASGGGGEVNNGGGIAEHNIVMAYWNLEKYIDICLTSASCQLNPVENQTLAAIRGSISREREQGDQIQYGSESGEPGSFLIDGQIRIAKTGDAVGSPVVFNRDLLYWRDQRGGWQHLDLPGAVAILVHELGHHQQTRSHTELDLLGAKVQTLLLKNSQEVRAWPFLPAISARAINFESPSSFAQLLVADQENQIDATPRISSGLGCGPDYPTAKLAGFNLWNLRWELKEGRESLPEWVVVAGAFVSCDYGLGPQPIGRFLVRVYIPLRTLENAPPGPQSYRITPEKITVEAQACTPGDVHCQ